MNQKYQQLGDEIHSAKTPNDIYSANNSARGTIINKESYLSEESQQSSAMSLELRQKVNDQFQRKKMEFYKMYNKNPKEYREERGRRVGRGNKVGYGIQEGAVDFPDDGGADEPPNVEQYSEYYEEFDQQEENEPDKKGSKQQKSKQSKDKKDADKTRKQYEKDMAKKAKEEEALRKKEEKDRLAQEKKEEQARLAQEKKEEQERLRQQKIAEQNMNEEEKKKYREKLAKEKEERQRLKDEEKRQKEEEKRKKLEEKNKAAADKQAEKEKSAAEKQAEKEKRAKEKQEAAEFAAQKRQEQREQQKRDKDASLAKKQEEKQKTAEQKELDKQRKADEKAQKQAQQKLDKEKEQEKRKQERERIIEEKKKELEEKQAKQDEIRAQKQAEKDAVEAKKQEQVDAVEAEKVAEEEAKAEEKKEEEEDQILFEQEDVKDEEKDKKTLNELEKKNDQKGIEKKKEEIKKREEKKKETRTEMKKQKKEKREVKKQKRTEEVKEQKKQVYEKKMVEVKKQREVQETKEKEIRKRQNERKAVEVANKKVKADDYEFEDGDLKEIEGLSQMEDKLSPEDQARSDKFCSKFCWMLWLSIPSILQVGTLFAQEIINQYIVGRTGDYTYLDALAMSNFLIYLGVYGTAIVFNSTLETLAPHAFARDMHEVAGHLLNRAMFLWLFIFGILFAGIFWIDEILINGLEWDEQEAINVQEYMVFASPALFFWGIMDAHRRFINSRQKFWIPCLTMIISVATHPFTCKYLLVDQQMGLQGLAIAQAITNFASYFFMRCIANCSPDMRKSLFFPRCKTCANLWQYLSFGIPQLIMFWIDTWQWQLMAFAAGWFGIVQQYATIALLTFLMICLLPGIAMASTSASLIGSKIGCANATSAQFYYRSAFIVQLFLCIAECVALSVFMALFLAKLTESKDLQEQLQSVYQLFILNVFLDSMRAMMKGVLRGVGIQNSVLPYHILLQGMVLPGVMYAFAFNVCEQPVMGIWIAMSIVDGLLLVAYWARIVTTDWHEISIKVIKRTNKISGQLQDEEELLKKPGTSEL